jgi:DNA-directed RNA polymerase sigma subunit (sigma70/sigma32)
VTRERIRQVEAKALGQVEKLYGYTVKRGSVNSQRDQRLKKRWVLFGG